MVNEEDNNGKNEGPVLTGNSEESVPNADIVLESDVVLEPTQRVINESLDDKVEVPFAELSDKVDEEAGKIIDLQEEKQKRQEAADTKSKKRKAAEVLGKSVRGSWRHRPAVAGAAATGGLIYALPYIRDFWAAILPSYEAARDGRMITHRNAGLEDAIAEIKEQEKGLKTEFKARPKLQRDLAGIKGDMKTVADDYGSAKHYAERMNDVVAKYFIKKAFKADEKYLTKLESIAAKKARLVLRKIDKLIAPKKTGPGVLESALVKFTKKYNEVQNLNNWYYFESHLWREVGKGNMTKAEVHALRNEFANSKKNLHVTLKTLRDRRTAAYNKKMQQFNKQQGKQTEDLKYNQQVRDQQKQLDMDSKHYRSIIEQARRDNYTHAVKMLDAIVETHREQYNMVILQEIGGKAVANELRLYQKDRNPKHLEVIAECFRSPQGQKNLEALLKAKGAKADVARKFMARLDKLQKQNATDKDYIKNIKQLYIELGVLRKDMKDYNIVYSQKILGETMEAIKSDKTLLDKLKQYDKESARLHKEVSKLKHWRDSARKVEGANIGPDGSICKAWEKPINPYVDYFAYGTVILGTALIVGAVAKAYAKRGLEKLGILGKKQVK